MTPSDTGGREACIWCGAPFDERSAHVLHRTRCAECGAATTDPPPTDEELAAAYGDWYRPHAERRFYFGADAILGRSRGLLAARIDEIAPAGPVLDVGAGDGTLIDALRAPGPRGHRPRAEPGPRRPARRAARRGQGRVGGGGLLALARAPARARGRRSATRPACSLPGGVVVVAVPNNDSVQAQAFGDRWLHLDLPRHLVHLSTGSLRRGLRDSGFKVERVSFVRGGQIVIGWLQGLVGLLPGHPDLYQALRREGARGVDQSASTRCSRSPPACCCSPSPRSRPAPRSRSTRGHRVRGGPQRLTGSARLEARARRPRRPHRSGDRAEVESLADLFGPTPAVGPWR